MPAIPQTILIAPDAFKGTLTAVEVAEAIAHGLEQRGRSVDLCPLADGGEGTLDVLVKALDGELRDVEVSDPLGRPVRASFGLAAARELGLAVARGLAVAIVESAQASGLGLVDPAERDPIAVSTAGTGELILAARDAGAKRIYLGVGGSATTDGGIGAVRAINAGGGLGKTKLVVLCDVRTPFEDAARVFAPQKGADEDGVRRLTQRLHGLARGFKRDPRGRPMTGAAGGLSGGLWAEFDAELVAGAPFLLDLLDFDRRMLTSRAVVTGEGRLDEQSLAGKLVSEVSTRARQSGVPCHAVVGKNALDAFGLRILDLQAVIEAGTTRALGAAGRKLAELI